MKSIQKNTLLALGLMVLAVGSTLYISYKDSLYVNNDELALATNKPYLIEKLEYVDSFIVPDVTTVTEFDTLLNYQPTAALFSVQAIADSITKEANNSFNPDINHSLPLLAHWNSGDIGVEGMTPDYVLSLIEEGKHILPSWKLEPYWATQLPQSYYEASILRAKELNLPLTFIIDPLESTFIDDSYYFSLDSAINPNVIDTNLSVMTKVSPFGPNELWSEIAKNHANNSMLQLIQEWYPNPPLIMFVDNTNTNKLSWNELNASKRYIDAYPNDETDTFKRTLVGAQWIEKYRLLHENFKNTLVSDAWKENTKFISYDSESLDIGSNDTWHYDSLITNQYFSAWPQTNDAINVEYITDGTTESLNNIVFNSNNLDFLLKEADKSNSDYTHQLSISDNNFYTTLDEYRGFTQLALWLTRPNIIREFTDASNDKTVIVPRYQAIVDSVELIHNETTLQKFWKDGKLVENTNTKIEQSINVPLVYENSSKWFLLDVDSNPVAPWTTTTEVPVYAIALEIGTVENREWLVYTQSPKGNLVNIIVTIPNYMDITINSSIQGDFYNIKENQDPSIIKINISNDTIPDVFNFLDHTNIAPSYIIESDIITISGINSPSPISISQGSSYRINGGTYTDDNRTVKNGDVVQVRHISSKNFFTSISSTLNIGGVLATFNSRTNIEDNTSINTINVVTDFFAVGDGTTDNTTMIKNAVLAAKATGKNLYFPAGIYQLNGASSGAVRFIGEDKETTIIKDTNATRTHNLAGAENITFINFKIEDYATPKSKIFKNCKFQITLPVPGNYRLFQSGFWVTTGIDNQFIDCEFEFPRIYMGLDITNYDSVLIKNCTFNGNAWHNISIGIPRVRNAKISIIGNTITGGTTGIFVGGSTHTAIEAGLIEGNTLYNQTEESIGFDSYGNNVDKLSVIATGQITDVWNDDNGRVVISMKDMVHVIKLDGIYTAVPAPISMRDDWKNFNFAFGENTNMEGEIVGIKDFNTVDNLITLDIITSSTNIKPGGRIGVYGGFYNWIIKKNTLIGGEMPISLWLNVFGMLVEENNISDSRAAGINIAGGEMLRGAYALAYHNIIRNNIFHNCDVNNTDRPSPEGGVIRFPSWRDGGSISGPMQYNNQFINNTVDSGRIFIEQQENFIFEGNNISDSVVTRVIDPK